MNEVYLLKKGVRFNPFEVLSLQEFDLIFSLFLKKAMIVHVMYKSMIFPTTK